ncbi:DUF5989 family protein [Thermomonas carbonis]|uniref:Uncharacterized protein n=1 Tax=Thermomonas carbonis TaxID=1463158 RepID=A0A7G9SV54_9GAMM|nr:DUF5989 family protein [Thermomonas carbonis]QNN71729.1 hypothetical protein H9L16_02810 [Thermomonas carbonis]GHC00850.1 hypothetical protein GCM10010080_12750 [Thermomonas carbonis]
MQRATQEDVLAERPRFGEHGQHDRVDRTQADRVVHDGQADSRRALVVGPSCIVSAVSLLATAYVMFDLLSDLWAYMRTRRKFWLAPLIIVLILLGALLVFAQGSVLAPFIYTIF